MSYRAGITLRFLVLSALAPDSSTSLQEVPAHSGDSENMEGNCRLPHVLPAAHRSRHMLTHSGPAAKEVAQLVIALAVACS